MDPSSDKIVADSQVIGEKLQSSAQSIPKESSSDSSSIDALDCVGKVPNTQSQNSVTGEKKKTTDFANSVERQVDQNEDPSKSEVINNFNGTLRTEIVEIVNQRIDGDCGCPKVSAEQANGRCKSALKSTGDGVRNGLKESGGAHGRNYDENKIESEISAYGDPGGGGNGADAFRKDKDKKEIPQPSKKGWKYFCRRTMADLTNEKLIPIKVLFFFKAATLFVLYPFLTLHLKSLGLNSAEAGINSALSPIVAICGHPFAGIIADKIGNFSVLLSALTFTTAGFALLLLLVPAARQTYVLSPSILFSLECHQNGLRLEMAETATCTLNVTQDSMPPSGPLTVQCGTFCPVARASFDRPMKPFGQDKLPLPINQSYLMSMKDFTFLPDAYSKPEFVCNGEAKRTCFLGFAEADTSLNFGEMEYDGLEMVGNGTVGENVTDLVFSIGHRGKFRFGTQQFANVPRCISTGNGIPKATDVNETDCVHKCFVAFDRWRFCSNKEETRVFDVQLTFWLYTLFRTILGLGSATVWIMFEGAVLAILKECGGDYGLQRVSAVIAAIFVSPLSGALIYTFKDFRPAFYLYAVLQCLSALLTLKIDLRFKLPGEHVLGHLKEVLSQCEILIFFCAMLLSGSAWGYLESFLFWFLQDMGGNEILMGLTISVGGLAGLPLLVVSRLIIKKTGHVNVLCLGLLFYGFRLFGYSYITNPWLALPFEAMEAITVSLAITAAATYAAALSTEQTIASVQGIMGALYFGIGRGAGSLVGGFLTSWYGSRPTFRIFGVAAFLSCLGYFVLNILWVRKHTRVKMGMDLYNLRGDKFDNILYKNSQTDDDQNVIKLNGGAVERSNESKNADQKDQQFDGGYLGPCDVNAFTDIPLDEDVTETNHSPQKKKQQKRPMFPLSGFLKNGNAYTTDDGNNQKRVK